MAKCANCESTSAYSVKSPGARPQEFCKEHLPKFLNASRLPAYVKEVSVDATTPSAPKTKKKTAVEKVEEPAPIIEETAPAPVEVEAVAEVVEDTPEVTE